MPAWKASSAFRSMPASARYWGRLGRDQDARALVLAVDALDRQDPLERRDAARAELAAGGAAELLQRLRGGPSGPVDARRQHRVERVGDVDDAGAERDLLPLEPV